MQPPATLVLGAPGSGKTDVTTTYIEAGVETFVIVTEPGGVESLLDACERRKLDVKKLHWATTLPAAAGWTAMEDMVKTIGNLSYEDIAKIKSGVGKEETRKPAMKLLKTLANFVCEHNGQSYGDTSKWGDDRALVFDSMSGLNLLAMALTIGYKPAAHQGEWGVAMNFVEQLLLKMTSDRNCFFSMTAHVEKELNEISGVNQIMASTLGKKLAPKVPRFFSEVVYAKRIVSGNTAKFTWATADANADLKNRALSIGTDLLPSYVPIVQAYRRRKSLAGSIAATPAQPTAAIPQTVQVAPMSPVKAAS